MRQMNSSIAEKVIDAVTIPEVLRRYGYPEGRGRRIPCPIHHGKDSNFCYTDKVFHCWTCGAKGNVIQFVMQLFNINFGQAVLKINSDFSLGLTAKKPTYRERKALAENARIQKAFNRWKSELNKKYLMLTAAYSVLYRQTLMNLDNKALIDYVSNLEVLLDQNIEEVRF